MNIRKNLLMLIVTISAFCAPSTKAVSQWALEKAQREFAKTQAQYQAQLIIAMAEEYEKQEREKQIARLICTALGYSIYYVGKGVCIATYQAGKAALYAAKATTKTAYWSILKPEVLNQKIKDGELEPFVGFACLAGIFTAGIVQIIDAATTQHA